MALLTEVPLRSRPLERFSTLLRPDEAADALRVSARLSARLADRTVWNVSSTAAGGGVAEMLRSLLGYARGAAIDARWAVIQGPPAFFRVTKRLHHALHGSAGDGSPLGPDERALYERVLCQNVLELAGLVRRRDVVLLHDPQTLGMAPHLVRQGALVLWRCHVGSERPHPQVELGWSFLRPDLGAPAALIFSRASYVPAEIERARIEIIPPSIDPFSAKNQPLDDATVRAILVQVGLVEGPPPAQASVFVREDGSPGRVDRGADVLRLGRAPEWRTPLVVQVSRWDRLKDPLGVLAGFARLLAPDAPADAELVLAGPSVRAVADDPEGPTVFEEVAAAWRALPQSQRRRIHLVSLPMADVEENAAIVNALQRHAAVVVQKSLHEGFGLTITEAMWKGRPVVASAVGGLLDQITNGTDGLLVQDPTAPAELAERLAWLLSDRPRAEALGQAAHAAVRARYLGIRALVRYGELIERVDR